MAAILVAITVSWSITIFARRNFVAGKLVIFSDNGGWSWFENERAICDSMTESIVLSSVANSEGRDGKQRDGDVNVVSYNMQTATKRSFTLSQHLESDDHCSASLLCLPDGRYLASYSKHSSDNQLRYRVSSQAHNTSEWEQERTFSTDGGTTYTNLCYLTSCNTVFDFYRDRGRGWDPNFVFCHLANGEHFEAGGRLFTGPEGNSGNKDRPYVLYVSNNVNEIHFVTTDNHPRNRKSNGIYHGYLKREDANTYGLYRSNRKRLGSLGLSRVSPYKASDFTPVIPAEAMTRPNEVFTRAWPADLELDREGYPYLIFTARAGDDQFDHRFMYARSDGNGWTVHELAKAGGYLCVDEPDYTGLAALDPCDPNSVYISTMIDPRTNLAMPHYELFAGVTNDGGLTWQWRPITFRSTTDNIRPIMPRPAQTTKVLLWLRGKYTSYKSYCLKVVGLIDVLTLRERQNEVL